MMGTGKKRFERAFSQAMGGKEDKPELVPGALGAYVAGIKSLRVADRPDYVWVRLRGNPADAIQAYNDVVSLHWDLPVLVCRDPVFTDRWKIWGRNISQYENWGGLTYIVAHGNQHTFGGGSHTGGDIVWTFKRQFMSLLPRPYASGTMNIWVEPDYYYWMGDYYWWPGSGSPDLTPYKPTGSQHAKFVTIYLDGDDGLLKALVGEEFNYVPPPDDPAPYMPIPEAANGIPICAVALMTGTSQIDWYNIYDLRIIPSSPIPTGSYFIEQMIAAAGVHRPVVDIPIALTTLTGTYWVVPDYKYTADSLALSVNGLVQSPNVHYAEQYPASGTFNFIGDGPPTGSFLVVWYGVPVT